MLLLVYQSIKDLQYVNFFFVCFRMSTARAACLPQCMIIRIGCLWPPIEG